jgi:hypothetical protein
VGLLYIVIDDFLHQYNLFVPELIKIDLYIEMKIIKTNRYASRIFIH